MKYFAMIDGAQRGPFELEDLVEAGVRPSTFVWCKGMSDWEKAEEVPDICRYFRIRIYDLMHPSSPPAFITPDNNQTSSESQNEIADPSRINRFTPFLKDNPEAEIPTLEEIDSRTDVSVPPKSMILPAVLVTVLCFPPAGVVAIYYAVKGKKMWEAGAHKEAHDLIRSSKMWTGITLCLGLILYAFLFRFL